MTQHIGGAWTCEAEWKRDIINLALANQWALADVYPFVFHHGTRRIQTIGSLNDWAILENIDFADAWPEAIAYAEGKHP